MFLPFRCLVSGLRSRNNSTASESGYGLVAERVLAKDEIRVRFPVPALDARKIKARSWRNPLSSPPASSSQTSRVGDNPVDMCIKDILRVHVKIDIMALYSHDSKRQSYFRVLYSFM